MLERVMRIMLAAELVPMVTAGSTQWMGVEKPEGGNHPSQAENTMISIMPCQKLGSDTPISEAAVATWSNMEYCFVADMIPQTMPMIPLMIPRKPARRSST